jgi:hypothetical protein
VICARPEEPSQPKNGVQVRLILEMESAPFTNDGDLRSALKRDLQLLHGCDPNSLIIEELGVLHGSSRVDLAVVNGTLHGYELKSDRDSLQRLPEQLAAYASVFDLMTIVVGERHVRRAVDLIPDWWGIKVARNESCGVLFCDLKLAIANPAPDPMSVVRLLWREEALALSQELPFLLERSRPTRDCVYAHLVQHSDFNWMRARIRDYLRKRPNWRSDGRQL